uniref:G protein-coupled receptor n=1 Tax=Globodera rostochiensis TaxID=31243 RepID=A0A914IG62_GLORO
MELLFFNPDEYERLYNCSSYEIDQVPLSKRQNIPFGVAFLSISIICEVLYVPCMIAIRKHMDSTCFKFMFYIAIADMLCLLVCGIVTGYLAIIGAVFCTAPTFIYISGAFALALWVTETTAEMFLAFNRCVELSSSRLADFLFGGKRIYLWMVMATLYGMYIVLFTKPLIFNGIYITWFQNPHVGYIDSFEDTYRNSLQSIQNLIVTSVLPGIYLLFALILFVKGRKISTGAGPDASSVNQKSIFIQILLISCVNAIAAAIYLSMNLVPLSKLLILVGQFCWIMDHGIPPIIYLLFNKTVRRDVLVMFVRPIGMVFPCVTLPSGDKTSIIRTLETNRVTATSKSIRTIMSQANRMKPLATIEPCATKWIQKC